MRELNRNAVLARAAGAANPDKPVYKRGFSGADFTDEGNKTLAALNPVHQPAQRFFDLFGMKEVARVWIDIEWIVFEPKETFCTWCLLFSQPSPLKRFYLYSLPLLSCPENLDSRYARKSRFTLSQDQRPCRPLESQENLVHCAARPASRIVTNRNIGSLNLSLIRQRQICRSSKRTL